MHLEIPTSPDFSFSETLRAHGWRRLLPFGWEEETQTLERVERLADGRVVLLRVRADEGKLLVAVSEDADTAEVIILVRRMLQLDLPIDAFHQFCRERPELCHIPVQRQGRMLISPTVWEDVCKVILTTNTTWVQTQAMTARIVNAYGSPLPSDPARSAFPTPAQIAAVPFDDFAACARLGYRAGAVHRLAGEIHTGALDLEALRDPQMDTATLWKRLLALRGVGPYAGACLLLYLGRPERVNADSWARMLLGKELGRPVSDKEVHDFFARYGEWRGLAYNFYPWREAEETAV